MEKYVSLNIFCHHYPGQEPQKGKPIANLPGLTNYNKPLIHKNLLYLDKLHRGYGMKFYIQLFMIICSGCLNTAFLHAQQHDRIWIFGNRAGIDFNTLPPTSFLFINTPPNLLYTALEADANVCDKNGRILFYTNGTAVYNRDQQVMPNGNNLVPLPNIGFYTPTNSSSQGTIIVPVPQDTNLYYIFSLTCAEMLTDFGKLYYSVVDMRLNGGRGDVVPQQKGILLGENFTEHMSAAAGSCESKGVWLILVSRQSGYFTSFKIDRWGLDPVPVISGSFTARPSSSTTGTITSNSSYNKLVVSSFNSPRDGSVSIYDFNNTTGTVTNEIILDTLSSYASCFSRGGSKIYYTLWDKLYQMDLSAGSAANIIASKTEIHSNLSFTDLKLGIDDRIYFKDAYSTTSLAAIRYPDLPGTACQVDPNSIQLAAGTNIHLGLPNIVPVFNDHTDTLYATRILRICKGSEAHLLPLIAAGQAPYWNSSTYAPYYNTAQEGTYWVRYRYNCAVYIDTFYVKYYDHTEAPTLIRDSVCPNETYFFNDISINTPGTYTSTFKNRYGCDSVVELRLSHKKMHKASFDFKMDDDICIRDSINATALDAFAYQWYLNGILYDSTKTIRFPLSEPLNGLLLLSTAENGCRDTAAKKIQVDICCGIFVPNAFSPNGDGLNDVFAPVRYGRILGYRLHIYNRYGELVFETEDMEASWDGRIHNAPADMGVYFYYLKGKCLDESEFIKKGDISLIR